MAFTSQQSKAAYKKLPPEVQNLIMSSETTELISSALKGTGLDDEQANFADSEILYAMFCLQSLDDAISNIAKLSSKDVASLSKLKTNLENNIFNKYKEFGVKIEKPVTPTLTPATPPTNLPMVEKGEVVHDARLNNGSVGQVPHVEQPVNTPVTPPAPQVKPEQPKVSVPDYRYESGKDPYREPLK